MGEGEEEMNDDELLRAAIEDLKAGRHLMIIGIILIASSLALLILVIILELN